ncbi:DUF998 domain-containing protein [Streptomyces sp. Edi2]|uniref:DUF998 domain-containing protein n=1 Tax=Streptomyces sp. Edi2 TaxID=3162528 RepID=UPI003305620D
MPASDRVTKPFRHPVSSLCLGRDGWAQTVNFLFAGLLSLLFAAGLWHVGRPWGGAWFIRSTGAS